MRLSITFDSFCALNFARCSPYFFVLSPRIVALECNWTAPTTQFRDALARQNKSWSESSSQKSSWSKNPSCCTFSAWSSSGPREPVSRTWKMSLSFRRLDLTSR
eukprot:scaffold12583_cov72-Phaeocystis_antarctica.AAC.2